MNRRHFISQCTYSCLALAVPGFLLSGCHSLYLQAALDTNLLKVPLSALEGHPANKSAPMVIALHEQLPFPVLVIKEDQYRAFEMKCTHQGAELQWSGSRLSCPAHGSEFGLRGEVLNGPAAEPLKEFKVTTDTQHILIQLS